MKLIAMRGLPASGKTTEARGWVKIDPAKRARVNRDALRDMCHDGMFLAETDVLGTERAIVAARDATVKALLERDLDVVVDDTNLTSKSVRDLRRLAAFAGADFEIWDLTNVGVEECLRRNAQREGRARVPDVVITGMHQRYIKGQPYPLPVADEPPDPDVPELYVPDTTLPPAWIFDLDGTLALMGARSHLDEDRVGEDRPNWPVIAAARAAFAAGHAIVVCSGRTDACRGESQRWLEKYVRVTYDMALMRAVGDLRPDAVVKLELFDRHIRGRYNVQGVYDDRNQVVRMWRSLGLTVFQVAEGNF